jgi:hypothetical protein
MGFLLFLCPIVDPEFITAAACPPDITRAAENSIEPL